jgi:hypothetical protein
LIDQVQWINTPAMLGQGVPMVAAVRDRGEAAERLALGDDQLVEFEWPVFGAPGL